MYLSPLALLMRARFRSRVNLRASDRLPDSGKFDALASYPCLGLGGDAWQAVESYEDVLGRTLKLNTFG